MSQHIGPRTISAIGGSVKRVGNYRVHTFPSELVTDGLVLNLDAGDPRSYPSSGTTWTDLSGNGYNGTFTAGQEPTYSNADGGTLYFSNNKEVQSFAPILTSFTNEAWVKIVGDGSNGYHVIFQKVGGYSGGAVYGIRITNNGSAYGMLYYGVTSNEVVQLNSTTTIQDNVWYHIVTTFDNDRNYKIYINGILENESVVPGVPLQVSSSMLYGQSDGRRLNGYLSIARVYNRALSAAEVAQNYDALRVRYGTYTNTFTPICGGGEGKVEVLCVAGGGGGGGYRGGGGGGAGGLIYNSSYSVTSNNGIQVSVGKGGKGGEGDSISRGQNGDNSVFSTLTSIGGGGGGTNGFNGANGGSGGGARHNTNQSPSSGTPGQGNSGGRGNDASTSGSGGGGAGEPGEDNVYQSNAGGDGGNGLAYSITGTSTYYAGGGGGGGSETGVINPGGLGGGGTGRPDTAPGGNGTPNTGGGGGGGGISPYEGGNGANGIVIVRYPATDYNVEVLVVGGGGGGGMDTGGGGGAGGLIYYSSYPVSSGKKLQVTVGKGGPRASTTAVNATAGGNSVFNTQVAIGGGYGSSNASLSPGGNGGSGGGGGAYSGYQGVGGTGIPGQGNSGGTAVSSGGGGGGGAGQSGFGGDGTANGDSASDGGNGLTYSITGSSVVYAAGGGGGQTINDNRGQGGSSGVGGDGGTSTRNPTDPDVNTGSGGGGGANVNQPNGVRRGTNGADGIVIIAYKGPQRGIGGTVDTTSRPGYTLHKFTTTGTDFFIP